MKSMTTYCLADMPLAEARAWLGYVGIGSPAGPSSRPTKQIARRLTPVERERVLMALAIVEVAAVAEREAGGNERPIRKDRK